MRRFLVSLVFAGCLCSTPKVVAITPCGNECYTSDAGTPGVGACRAGAWYCVAGEAPTCLQEVGPSEEICDGLDNDCDGKIDEPLWRYCDGACGQGTETCYRGTWTACTAPAPLAEVCDGLDNDCDGKIDNGLPLEFCYTGSSTSAGVGECGPGVVKCVKGTATCAGETKSTWEICDGKDNDCDGQVDEGLAQVKVDFVFVVDNSGSMQRFIDAVKAASSAFAATHAGRTEVRWALFGAPDNDPGHDGEVRVISYLTDVATFDGLMQAQDASGGGQEPTLDAVVWLAQPTNPLGLDWTPGAQRHVILFSDETPQSYVRPPYSYWDSTAAMLYAGPEFHLHVFTVPYYVAAFESLGPPRQLDVQPLTDDAAAMTAALSVLVQFATCQAAP